MDKKLSNVTERFLRYVKVDTRSADGAESIPSTQKQFNLARMIEAEMKEIGLEDVRLDEHCYVYGFIPATDASLPTLGFIAHMDTVEWAGEQSVNPRIVESYDGESIRLNDSVSIDTEVFPYMKALAGQDLIVTDGTTVLGADDKAGVAEIMTMAETLIKDKSIRHGRIAIGFTPDEEVGNGATLFDVKGFGADFAYTVDGGPIGEIEYENFNAASAVLTVHGVGVHPGEAKDVMVNAATVAIEFHDMLPKTEVPENTCGYQGFFHLHDMQGSVTEATLRYIIRDHDAKSFEARKALFLALASEINRRYGKGTAVATVKDSYYNMKEKIEPHMQLIHKAIAAFEKNGIPARTVPIRGGTDGAHLSWEGLPCPNLPTGGYNYHGVREWIPARSLDQITDVLVDLVVSFAE